MKYASASVHDDFESGATADWYPVCVWRVGARGKRGVQGGICFANVLMSFRSFCIAVVLKI